MDKQGKKKKNGFATSLGLIFWLGLLAFVAYRAILSVPADRDKLYLINTKYNGYQNEILQPGRYYISWQNLLPGNVELLAIPNQVQEIYLSQRFTLPSATNYQVLLPSLGPDLLAASQATPELRSNSNPFEYQIEMTLNYRFRPEELLAFALNPANAAVPSAQNHDPNTSPSGVKGDLTGARWDGAATSLTQRLEAKLRQRMGQEIEAMFSQEKASNAVNAGSAASVEHYLRQVVAQGFPELELIALDVHNYQQPDLELYNTVKQAYQVLLQQLSSQSLVHLLDQQNNRIAQELYLQNMERLGQILTEYPILIQYFAVTQAPSQLSQGQLSQGAFDSRLNPTANLRNNILQGVLQGATEQTQP